MRNNSWRDRCQRQRVVVAPSIAGSCDRFTKTLRGSIDTCFVVQSTGRFDDWIVDWFRILEFDERQQRVLVETRIRATIRALFVVRIWDRLHFDVRWSTSQRVNVRAAFNDESSTTTVRRSGYLVFWVRFHLCYFHFTVVS